MFWKYFILFYWSSIHCYSCNKDGITRLLKASRTHKEWRPVGEILGVKTRQPFASLSKWGFHMEISNKMLPCRPTTAAVES